MSGPFLLVENATAHYGVSQALFGVDLEVQPGQAVALLGRNGMGKTTTMRLITSVLKPGQGRVVIAGRDTARLPVHKVAALGIALVPEGRRCFARLSVRENLLVAARPGHWDFSTVTQLFPRLAERRDQNATTLSGGEQQMLAIGRALMTNPKLLLLDEATEGLAPVVRAEIWNAIGRLKDSGLSILVVDKSIPELRKVADRFTMLERGATVWTGSKEELTGEMCARYLGV
ncbi:MAG: ABC transporter ATP-binding protein [Nitratireductor sp.]|jgi:branched-chain amino acid transport system ATP-binding protein|nr:ABC transporter ATP-binding protein [Nitratireductor sp.]